MRAEEGESLRKLVFLRGVFLGEERVAGREKSDDQRTSSSRSSSSPSSAGFRTLGELEKIPRKRSEGESSCGWKASMKSFAENRR